MPVAGLSAESGAPILFASAAGVPRGHRGRPRTTSATPRSTSSARASCTTPSCRNCAITGHVTAINGTTSARRRRPHPDRQLDRDRALHRRQPSAGGSKNRATGSCSPTPPARWTGPPRRCCRRAASTAPCCCSKAPPGYRPRWRAYLADIQPAYTSAPAVPARARRLQSRLADRRRNMITPVTQAELDSLLRSSRASRAAKKLRAEGTDSNLNPNERGRGPTARGAQAGPPAR